jgi:acetylcholinesterase
MRAMPPRKALCFIGLLIAGIHAATSSPPTVDLGYATYEGTAQSNGQNQFLGIRFAEAPLGNLRFRKPQPPAKMEGVQEAKAFGPICFGIGGSLANTSSEDCLYLNVWAPSDATPNSKLPVYFWIQGGGYVSNSNANVSFFSFQSQNREVSSNGYSQYNGSDLVQFTGNQMIFVNINYRVGPFGFLTSEKVRKDGDLNVGLLDQRQALEWVQEHITKVSYIYSPNMSYSTSQCSQLLFIQFGGDPDRVVLVGCSAGAGSIAMHLIAFDGKPTRLFAGVFGVSPFFPTQMHVSQLEWQFDLFASRTGCNGTSDPLECLRGQNSTVLQTANTFMARPGRTGNTQFPFTPAIDGNLIADFPYRMFEQGRFVRVPSIFG